MQKHSLYIILFLSFTLLTGCGTTQPDAYLEAINASDFTPPIGRAANPPPNSAGERRLLTAISTDGIHFTPTGKILTDQGNVPDMVITTDGTIMLYYVGGSVEEGKEESTAMALSHDNGETWEFHALTFNNFPTSRDPSDPDVVMLPDGTYRMYYTTDVAKKKIGIAYAESADGIAFAYKGTALVLDEGVMDSSTLFFDDVWHMYVLQQQGSEQIHATSTDGKTFTIANGEKLHFPLVGYISSNPLIENDTVRMFAFNLPEKNIRSFTTSDMETWTSSDIALTGDDATTLESNYIQDSTVAELNDGSYLMVYVSEIPKEE